MQPSMSIEGILDIRLTVQQWALSPKPYPGMGWTGLHLGEGNLPCFCAPRKQNSDPPPHVLPLVAPDWGITQQVLGDIRVADNVTSGQDIARLGYCSCGVFSRHLSGLELSPHYPALTSYFMPEHKHGNIRRHHSWQCFLGISQNIGAGKTILF